jgi:hypothetical protein
LALPSLNVDHIKVKVDTGARSSALHAFDVESFEQDGQPWVRFNIHPEQRRRDRVIVATARLLDERPVRNSGGQAEQRPVIQTSVCLNGQQWDIELTLTNRDVMGFRMLLGRQAIRDRFWVDPGRSYLQSTPRDRPMFMAENNE